MTNSDFFKIFKKCTLCFMGRLDRYVYNFQVDTFENDVFIAFETSKIATFHDIPMHYHAIMFLFLCVVLCAQRGSLVFFSSSGR